MIAPSSPRKNRTVEMQEPGPILEKMLTASLSRAAVNTSPLLAWPLACGHAVSERTRAVSFDKNTLTVEVQDLAWRAELRRFSSQYLVILNRYCREDVNRIEFMATGRQTPKHES